MNCPDGFSDPTGLVGTRPIVQSLPRQRSTLLDHRMVESWKWRGHWYLNRWPSPKAMASTRAKVTQRTARNSASWPLNAVVDGLNPVLRGWCAYFAAAGNSSAKFHALDTYVHQRMALLASDKYGLHAGRSQSS